MRSGKCIGILLLWMQAALSLPAQELPVQAEQELEGLAAALEADPEDDGYLQELIEFKKNPVNLNRASGEELKQLRLLTDIQVMNLLNYRQLLGRFIHLYELQAVPGVDPVTIRKLLPYITIAVPIPVKEETVRRFSQGVHQLLGRVSQVLEKAKGYLQADSGNYYTGNPLRFLLRYRYQYKSGLQFGGLGEKDAGEQFFKGAQRKGFDFYSFHFFTRKWGPVQALALGDYTVNLGQGLIHWQGLAFRKSAEITAIKRQSAILRPYQSAGEFNFHRGAGISLRKGNLTSTAFFSVRKMDGNKVTGTTPADDRISSLLTSGYHRSISEIRDRNTVTQWTGGGNISWHGRRWQAGLNGVVYKFSLPLQKREEPYNIYSIRGKRWYNISADYSYTGRNFHVFGEIALDKNGHRALVNGLLISVDPKADLGFLYRNMDAAYQSLQGNAFTEGTSPGNEQGIYAAVRLRPADGWQVDAYADLYYFPGLKFQADAASRGKDFLLQLSYTPRRHIEITSRLRMESRQANQELAGVNNNVLGYCLRQSWRTQVNYQFSKDITLRNRVECLWYGQEDAQKEEGFLAYLDLLYKPLLRPWSGVFRLQYFETDAYNSRIYAYENDVQYSYSIPVFYDRGFRYYATISYDFSRSLSFWMRWAQTIYPGRASIGSGLDEVPANTRSQATLQVRWTF